MEKEIMIYISDYELDRWLLEDIAYGDLTTRSLGIGTQFGQMHFIRRNAGIVSGIRPAERLLKRLGLDVILHGQDAEWIGAGQCLISTTGQVASLMQGWKVVQNILEWCGGVASYTHNMLTKAKSINPNFTLACTRKIIPGTKTLALQAILDGGATIHRVGTAETILLFANHLNFFNSSKDWQKIIQTLRQAAPERYIIVEAKTQQEALDILPHQPDLIQLDKLPLEHLELITTTAKQYACQLAVTGGIHINNIEAYAHSGIQLAISSAPYHSPPCDIQVKLHP